MKVLQMKISGPDPKSTSGLNPSPSAGAGAGSVSKPSAGQSVATDEAQLSSLSGYLSSALTGSPTHLAKVSELGAAVSTGQYHVDSFAVSGSLIQHGIEFGGASYSALST
jgi:anti-sigma28 factor (negative regulator of flagellin synthesis)